MDEACKKTPYLALMQTAKAVHERMRRAAASENLNPTEFSILEVLFLNGKQTIHQVGESILVSSGSMTYTIDKLENRGLIYRSACPDDRRAIHLDLTELGKKQMEKIMPKHQALTSYVLGSLKNDEAERLVEMLNRVKNRAEN
ncbi:MULTISPECIES: MarR family transcriptional regulator [Bacillaceae]|uniref:MarR family transcriptional regulator n=1 Tax=Metabacillus sediminis TaxID=3117746 RepID=A0ABZ2NKF6_9BACI|nr:MarR family transcriptional regulator [Bacillus sp. SJS]